MYVWCTQKVPTKRRSQSESRQIQRVAVEGGMVTRRQKQSWDKATQSQLELVRSQAARCPSLSWDPRKEPIPTPISIPSPKRTPRLGWDNQVRMGSPDPASHKFVCCVMALPPLASTKHAFQILSIFKDFSP